MACAKAQEVEGNTAQQKELHQLHLFNGTCFPNGHESSPNKINKIKLHPLELQLNE